MFCGKCDKHIAMCDCDDIDERLKSISESDHVFLAWCKKCDRHVDRCICKTENQIDH